MLKKVISGGQSGADEAGLRAAKLAGLETGGTAPSSYRTQNGPNLELRDVFGLKEHSSYSYPPRTEDNVKDSDGTIRIATNINSSGEKCTLRYIVYHQKPKLDINPDNPPDPQEIADWIKNNDIKTLNVAGNSEKTSPGIEQKAINILYAAFRLLKEKDDRQTV